MNILVDSCIWISLCDPTEVNHAEVVSMMERIIRDKHTILVPHPVLYETLCSNMVKKHKQVQSLAMYFSKVEKIPDMEYVNEAYHIVEQQANMNKGTASMVDVVIMLMAKDVKNNAKAIMTTNGRDFSDFCRKSNIFMIDSMEILKAL